MKKRGSLYRHPSHNSRPSHCPSLPERATQKPTPIYDIPHPWHTLSHDRVHLGLVMYTHIHKASTVALFFDSDWKVAKFRVVKNKALVNAFHQMSPTLRASAITVAPIRVERCKITKYSQTKQMNMLFMAVFCKNIKKDSDKQIKRLYFSNFA